MVQNKTLSCRIYLYSYCRRFFYSLHKLTYNIIFFQSSLEPFETKDSDSTDIERSSLSISAIVGSTVAALLIVSAALVPVLLLKTRYDNRFVNIKAPYVCQLNRSVQTLYVYLKSSLKTILYRFRSFSKFSKTVRSIRKFPKISQKYSKIVKSPQKWF